MSKILLALIILSAGAGGFLTARQSTRERARATDANREAWLAQTQQLAALRREQSDLAARVRELNSSLAHRPAVAESALWSILKTNRADRLPRELRERLLGELGFNWQLSPDFILVTKKAVRDTGAWMLGDGKLSEVAAAILAMTPEERTQVEAALQQAQTDFNDWALAHVERREPQDGALAHYFLPGDPGMVRRITENIASGVLVALGPERAEIMRRSVSSWMSDNVDVSRKGASLVILRELVGNEQRLKGEKLNSEKREGVIANSSGYLPEFNLPATFRPIFPNGWADLAAREGFELPKRISEK